MLFTFQYDMIGKKVLSFIHHDDHKELTKQFMISMPPSMGLLNTDDVEENEDEGLFLHVCFVFSAVRHCDTPTPPHTHQNFLSV